MGRDRFVKWRGEAPSRETVETTAAEFFGPSVNVTTDPGKSVFYTLPMAFSDPKHPLSEYRRDGEGRCVELWFHEGSINIETRHADRFTEAVADELAATLSWYYNGVIEGGVSRREYAHFVGETECQRYARSLAEAIDRGSVPIEKVVAYLRRKDGWLRHESVYEPLGSQYWFWGGNLSHRVILRSDFVRLEDVREIARHEGRKTVAVVGEIMGRGDA